MKRTIQLSTIAILGLTIAYSNLEGVFCPSPTQEVVNAYEVSNEVVERTIEAKLHIAEQLDKEEIHFSANDVTERSNLTVSNIESILEGTSLYSLAPHYLELENEYGLNALFILSLTIEESGWGTSRITHDNNNISGQRINGVYRTFDSKYQCLRETFRLISEEYISEEGKYYVGSSDIYDINGTYCPDTAKDSWANNIIEISNNIIESIN